MCTIVFEQLFKVKQIKSNAFNIFILGFIFSELGILSSLLIFRRNFEYAGLLSIAFTSLLALPFLYSLLDFRNIEMSNGKSFFKTIFTNNKTILNAYLLLFLGIFLSYALFSIAMPNFSTYTIFKSQFSSANLAGQATTVQLNFGDILGNNFQVLMASFIFSLLFGVGSILFLTWNASVWGTIMGFFAKQSALVISQNPFVAFSIMFVKFLPHLVTEAASYFFAVIAGVVISQTLVNENYKSEKFQYTLLEGLTLFFIAVVLLFIAAWLEVYLFPLL
ncbi:hypothetical protein C4573_01305 [Candidatus Woesearchaeota archaeon]|nr:MAG: hypothetical protein C4573_01305 [Candidatus Woesearchaeota archaeon]